MQIIVRNFYRPLFFLAAAFPVNVTKGNKALSSEPYGTGFDDLSCWHDVSACKKALSVKKCLVFKCSLCANVQKKKQKKKTKGNILL